MEHIIASSSELASVLMGYNVDAGWRCQPDVCIDVPFDEWCSFNKRYGQIRTCISRIDIATYNLDLATTLYNEVLYAYSTGGEATPIVPYNRDVKEDRYSLDEYLSQFTRLTRDTERVNSIIIGRNIRKYYEKFNPNMEVYVHIDSSKLSDWNYKLYMVALSYIQFKNKLINLQWR